MLINISSQLVAIQLFNLQRQNVYEKVEPAAIASDHKHLHFLSSFFTTNIF